MRWTTAFVFVLATAGIAAADDKADLKKTLDARLAAAKAGDVAKYIETSPKKFAEYFQTVSEHTEATAAWHAALRAKFPADAEKFFSGGGTLKSKMLEIKSFALVGDPKFSGDSVTFDLRVGRAFANGQKSENVEPFVGVREDGAWKVVDAKTDKNAKGYLSTVPGIKRQIPAIAQAARDVESGKYTDFRTALETSVAAIRKAEQGK